MSKSLNTQQLEVIFQSRPDILDGIRKEANSPARITLFNNIASFVYDRLGAPVEPATKKRKLDAGGKAVTTANGSSVTSADVSEEEVLLEVKDISFSIPQRKKFDLCFTKKHIYARSAGASVPGMVYSWDNIEYTFYLPVPEKAQLQHNYILFPKGSCFLGLGKNAPEDVPEPLLFTIPSGAPKPGTIGGAAAANATTFADSFSMLMHWALTANLPQNARIVSANPDKFHSVLRQAHRPKDPAVYVKAFRGSKEGFLFFLDNGILWGYKKPLLFIPLTSIAAISYMNVLRTTFNMVVEVFIPGKSDETEEIEFGMLDQADYPGIDEKYVKRHSLQDRSMAEQRKAKKELAEGQKKGKESEDGDGAANEGEDGANGRTVLEQAQWEEEQRIQDEEDELEEDYDPGSDGGSDDSGTSDDDDDDDDEDEGGGEGEDEGDNDE